jgi:hypothetical protein
MKIIYIIGIIMMSAFILKSNSAKSQTSERWSYVTSENNYKIKVYYDLKSLKYFSKPEGYGNDKAYYASIWVKYKYETPTKIIPNSEGNPNYEEIITEYLERIEINITRGKYEVTKDYLCYNKDKSFTFNDYGYNIFFKTYYITPLTVYEKIYFIVKDNYNLEK